MKNQNASNCYDPVPTSEYPELTPFPKDGPKPLLPNSWACSAVLHPFSKLQSNSTPDDEASPFFELCTANVLLIEGKGMQAALRGESGRTWFYVITADGTTVSMDGKPPIQLPNIGWTVPTNDWFGNKSSEASCAGTSYLNWMEAQQVDWWKIPVGTSTNGSPVPATWMWFDHTTKFPTRLMFGQGPSNGPTHGDPGQLALFQMFSFTYFSSFQKLKDDASLDQADSSSVTGFQFGNPKGYELFEWNTNFGMTAFMTPVNEAFNPLPTRVLYKWKTEGYTNSTDRSQNTLMEYSRYNHHSPFTSQVALLTGPSPLPVNTPANSGAGFIINYDGETIQHCSGFANFPFPQEPPNWAKIPGVEGKIHATVENNAALCPGNIVNIISVLFPPSGEHYPDNTYLWTWYSPINESGSESRPVTFMQSQSGVNKGTSLALADYFYYQHFTTEIEGCNFDVPPSDFKIPANKKWVETGIVINNLTSAEIVVTGGEWTANPGSNGGQLYGPEGNPEGILAKPGYAIPDVPEGMLVGKVGNTVFPIGRHATTPQGIVGALTLCINDDLNGEYGAGYTDNQGYMDVQIAVSNV